MPTTIYIILSSLLLLMFFIQFLFILKFSKTFKKILALSKPSNISTNNSIQVSIIICGHNESQELHHHLSTFLSTAPSCSSFECIYINDRSTDHSITILNDLSTTYPQLKIIDLPVDLPKILPGKKDALKRGVEAAQGEIILFTDADCWIEEKNWIYNWWHWMETHQADVGLGIGLYQSHTGILNRFIQFETMNSFMQYGSLSIHQKAYMGVGRNLAYRSHILKEVFRDPKFLSFYASTTGGDDDLLITYLQRKNKKILPFFHAQQATLSTPPTRWKEYWAQKSRHVSTGKFYASNVKKTLGLYALSQSLFWLFALLHMIFFPSFWSIVLLLIYFLLKSMLYNKWQVFSKYRQNSFTFVLYEWLWALYHLYLSPYIFWKNKQQWTSS